jgi:oligosaccharide repeat unit polymerase
MEQNNSNQNSSATICSGKSKFYQIWQLPILTFLIGCFCILISYFLLTQISRQNYSLRTLIIGIIVFFSLSFHLIARKAFRDPFHPDILFTIGHLAQFIIPIIIFATGIFDDVMYEHVMQVKDYFPETLFAVLIAQTAFNLPFCISPFRQYELSDNRANKFPLFIALMAVGVWIARVALVSTGSYFHYIPGLDFVNTSALYSPLATISTLGRIVLIFVSIKVFKKTKSRNTTLGTIYIFVEISWHLLSGKRMGLLMTLVCIILAYIFVKKKIPIIHILCFMLVLIIGSPLIVHYRSVIREASNQDNKKTMITLTEKAFKDVINSNMKESLHMVIDRLNDGQFTAGCLKSVPEQIPFLQDKSYKMILWIPVPRVLYRQRPKFLLDYFNIIQGKPIGVTVAPTTTVGEAYINFGWPGIPVVFLILGTIYKLFEYIFRLKLSSSQTAILLFFCVMIIGMTVEPAVVQLSWMLKITILLLTCKFFEFGLAFRKKLYP